jgi:hypothetical protein
MTRLYIIIMTAIFCLLTAALYAVHIIWPTYNFVLLEAGNALVYTLSIISFLVVLKQLKQSPMAFTRGVTGASFLRLMVYMVALVVYISINRATLHKPSIFVFFGLYAVFTAVETVLLAQIAKSAS